MKENSPEGLEVRRWRAKPGPGEPRAKFGAAKDHVFVGPQNQSTGHEGSVASMTPRRSTIADHWETGLSLTPDKRRRLLFATIASAATGGIIYVLVMHVALPSVRARLTPAYVEWLRDAFAAHPFIVLGVIVMFAAVLAAPVFGVFRWVYGPLTRR